MREWEPDGLFACFDSRGTAPQRSPRRERKLTAAAPRREARSGEAAREADRSQVAQGAAEAEGQGAEADGEAAPRDQAARTGRRSAPGRSESWRSPAVVAGLLAAGYQLWFRSSSFVAVEQVTVAGMTGPERAAAEAALTKAAKDMTTLDVDVDALRAAVAGLATVVDVEADADFPHGLAITVHERPPVLIAAAGGRALPVAGDGTVLAGVDASGRGPS